MQQFQITLWNEKIKSYNRISWIIILIHGLIFLYFTIYSTNKITGGISLGVSAFLIILFWIKYYSGKRWRPGLHPFFLVLMIGWLNTPQFWLAVIPILFDTLYVIATRKLVAAFSETGIIYPSFPSRKITWDKLNNVILKDGMITIDFKSDKVIQQTVDETAIPVNEEEFNEFCKNQLRKSGQRNDGPGIGEALEGLGEFISSIT